MGMPTPHRILPGGVSPDRMPPAAAQKPADSTTRRVSKSRRRNQLVRRLIDAKRGLSRSPKCALVSRTGLPHLGVRIKAPIATFSRRSAPLSRRHLRTEGCAVPPGLPPLVTSELLGRFFRTVSASNSRIDVTRSVGIATLRASLLARCFIPVRNTVSEGHTKMVLRRVGGEGLHQSRGARTTLTSFMARSSWSTVGAPFATRTEGGGPHRS